tara:strand:- start:9904 stop:11721 length:1818 start_codon:yes stop_codon:yes gene_type:complete
MVHRMWAREMGKRKMKRFVWDIETWGLDARNFAFACVINIDTDEEMYFDNTTDLRGYFESQAPCAVYAHNSHGFDTFSIIGKEEAYNAKKIAMGTRIYELTINKVRYRDTKHLFPMKLSQLGDALGYPKGETPEDYITGNRREITSEDIEYCYQDCRILVRAINNMESLAAEWIGKDVSKVAIPLTTASMAYRVWSETCWPEHWGWHPKKDPTKWVKGVSCHPRYNQSAKEAYAGGRVQVLGTPGKTYYDIISYDANSMFPSVQVNNIFPDMKHCATFGPSPEVMYSIMKSEDRVLWANVRLTASKDAERFLPSRNEKGRLDWTQNEFSGWLAEPELEYALNSAGWELEKLNQLHTAKAINPFRNHVNKFYNLRLEAKKNNDPNEIFYKLLLNSGYGKYAQRGTASRIENWGEMQKIFENDDWEQNYHLKFYDSKNLEMPYLIDLESANRIPDSQWFGFASFITSGARVELQKAISAAGEHAYYCDTDSVYMNVEAKKNFEKLIPLGNNLGEWKQEQEKPLGKGIFYEPKAYTLFGNDGLRATVKHKGVQVKDRFGNWLPNAGDLTKPQTSTSTVKLYSALRRGLEPGVGLTTTKVSKRWGVEKW